MQAKEIKTKIKSISNIEQITKTMEMVSVAKMKKAVAKATASREYARYGLELLVNVSQEPDVSHPYLEEGTGTKTLLVIIGSNKGLCGAYNVNVNKQVRELVKQETEGSIDTVTIGKQAEKIARRNSLPVVASFTQFGDTITAEEARSIVSLMTEQFESSTYKTVAIAYTRFIKPLTYKPTIQPFLPISPEAFSTMIESIKSEEEKAEPTPLSLYTLEPDADEILENVVPILLQAVLYQTLLESAASEHSSRMVAMKGATENAGNLLEDLRLSYNKARQEAITREISEIAAGGEATSN